MKLDYKWVALSNTTLGVLMVTINQSIILIALPDIFRGIHLDPLEPGNTSYLLWMILGFLVVLAVLVVSLGRLGDMFGRVRMYNLGFAVFTVFSILLSVTWMHGSSGALWLIVMRLGQGIGGAMLFANSSAILTDAFPQDQRGLALGINTIAGIAGSFLGLVLGGLLAPVSWRLVFLVSVPVGVFATVWAYRKLIDTGERNPARIDWWGNITFAVGLIAVMVGITYGIQPYGGHTMGWTSPFVVACIAGGVALLAAFVLIERRVAEPMFHLQLFRIRAFTAGNIATLLAAMGRGGLQFILIIWLQGIWLPEHGYDFARTPLWAGIYMLPLIAGFLVAGPVSGYLSDRYGARPFATGGMLLSALGFLLLMLLPVDFSYTWFALILLAEGIGMGLFSPPNRAGVMNSLPPSQRGVGGGMNATFQNAASVLSIGLFFSLMIIGLAASLPRDAARRPGRARRARGHRRARREPAARLDAVRRVPGLQPRPEPARRAHAALADARAGARADRPQLLPDADLRRRSRRRCSTRSCSRSPPAWSPPSPRCCAAASTTGASPSGSRSRLKQARRRRCRRADAAGREQHLDDAVGREAARVDREREVPGVVDVDAVERLDPRVLAVVVVLDGLLGAAPVDEVLALVGRDAPGERCPDADVDRRRVVGQRGEAGRGEDHAGHLRGLAQDRAAELGQRAEHAELAHRLRRPGRHRDAQRRHGEPAADALLELAHIADVGVQLTSEERQRRAIEQRRVGGRSKVRGNLSAAGAFLSRNRPHSHRTPR